MLTRAQLIEKYPSGVQIRGDWQTVISDKTAAFHGKKSFELSGLNSEDVQFLRRLKAGLATSEMDSARDWKFLAILEERGALKFVPETPGKADVVRQVEWLSYFHCKPNAVQQKLEEKKVMIIGCGGTGVIIGTHLARAGVNRFVLIDPAVVDAPDLNRQLSYFPENLGTKKVDVLAAELRRLRPEVDVAAMPFGVQDVSALRKWIREEKVDLVVNCADKPVGLIQAWVAEACREERVAGLFGGVGFGDASVGPLLIEPSALSAYQRAMTRAHAAFNVGEQPLQASLCFTNSWASVMIAFEAFKFLSGVGELKTLNQSLVVDFFEQSTRVEAQWHS